MTKSLAVQMNNKPDATNENAIESLIAGVGQVPGVPQAGTINPQELLALYAVLAYVAHSQNVRQELVQNIVEAEFHVEHIAKIPPRDFQKVMEFLVDLRMDDMRSRK